MYFYFTKFKWQEISLFNNISNEGTEIITINSIASSL